MMKLLTNPPLSLPLEEAEQIAPSLRYFWANIAEGDQKFDYPHFPKPVRSYFQEFSTPHPIDNHVKLILD